ncbi:hypothetical protein [Ostreiculturibacter nitratireducens]|uniref:hypothetical protein n=1 Tax=Ostreiculturibacter nitratireducens TaxID=3075226 RepID=UPI0031B6116E
MEITMHEEHETPIRTRPDGSIDTAYYMARGRLARSEQAHRLARSLVPAARSQPDRSWLDRLMGLMRVPLRRNT